MEENQQSTNIVGTVNVYRTEVGLMGCADVF